MFTGSIREDVLATVNIIFFFISQMVIVIIAGRIPAIFNSLKNTVISVIYFKRIKMVVRSKRNAKRTSG